MSGSRRLPEPTVALSIPCRKCKRADAWRVLRGYYCSTCDTFTADATTPPPNLSTSEGDADE